MKFRRTPHLEGEIPGWESVEAALAGLEELEAPAGLRDRIMAAVGELPLPQRPEFMPAHHRADLGRTMVLFSAAVAAGGLLGLFLAPARFLAFAGGLWFLLEGVVAALMGVGRSFSALSNALAGRAWSAAPLLAVGAVVAFLATEWGLLSRITAGRPAGS